VINLVKKNEKNKTTSKDKIKTKSEKVVQKTSIKKTPIKKAPLKTKTKKVKTPVEKTTVKPKPTIEEKEIKLKKIESKFFIIKKRINEKEESEFGKFDLHIHSKFSACAVNEPETIVKKAKEAGLKGFAITDHNSIRAWPSLNRLAAQNDLIFVPGQEVDVTFNGRKIGHVLALFTYDKITATDIFEIVDEIRSQSALLSLPHPFDFTREFKGFEYLSSNGPISKYINAIETFNSRVLRESANQKAKDFAEKNGLFQTAGSDAHMPYEIGNGYLIAKANTELDLLREIKLGRVVANGRLSGLKPKIHTLGAYMNLLQDNNFK